MIQHLHALPDIEDVLAGEGRLWHLEFVGERQLQTFILLNILNVKKDFLIS